MGVNRRRITKPKSSSSYGAHARALAGDARRDFEGTWPPQTESNGEDEN